MNKLIKAEDLFLAIRDDAAINSENFARVVEHLRNTQPVDAVEVVRGKWEVVHGVFTPGGDPLLRCSICRSKESEHLCGVECRVVWHYCPSCGARMDMGYGRW